MRQLLQRLDPDTATVFERATTHTSVAEIAKQLEYDEQEVEARLQIVWDDMEDIARKARGTLREEAWAVLESCARLDAFHTVVPSDQRGQARSSAFLAQLDHLLRRSEE